MPASVRWSEHKDHHPAVSADVASSGDLGLSAEDVDVLQRTAFQLAGWPESPHPDGALRWVAANHRYNALLWEEEDQARRTDVPDAEIVKNKRAIDRYNQLRNDAIEAIDETILSAVQDVALQEDAWINSETAGSIIDRLSINALKQHHMRLQLERTGVSQSHRLSCAAKLERLQQQREDLLECLDRLLRGMREGVCGYRIYRQFKMYNDPSLNPYLCGMKGSSPATTTTGQPALNS
ncbi:DUF4254 domain-containing protein [Caldimonas brevitalea]|uniref:DUF4254 domain-containing protein n=1 Tax=Caldimonas brevitalea TaxID=413882 RepID=A0A0G3BJG0_9BURK|nr:DUF4254 domain-containing protein [Caldimonas brevitalea]AKJ27511.1 hypothetical protein AAW51_0820 [Caldimonas brevitalea]